MSLRIDRITIGVPDVASARRFYEQGFGCEVRTETSDTLTFALGGNASEFAVRPWQAVADDAGVGGAGEGFRAYTLSYIVDSADGVDALLAARRARRGHGVEAAEERRLGLQRVPHRPERLPVEGRLVQAPPDLRSRRVRCRHARARTD